MGFIFYLSSRTADESSAQSGRLLSFLISIFGDNFFTDFIVRKTAHCLEFAGLCFLMNFAFYFSFSKQEKALSLIFTSLYALSDEIHQIFIDGRSCEFRDWVIDTAGALIGIATFLLVMLIIKKRKGD